MKKFLVFLSISLLAITSQAQTVEKPKFRVLAIAEIGGGHVLFTEAAKIWLNKLAADSNFTIDYITDTKPITKEFLSKYQLFIQLNYPPYPWSKEAQDAFEDYMEQGRGGWVGFHHPTLLGVLTGTPCGNGIRPLWAALCLRITCPAAHQPNLR
jgi:hypothetical protein